MLSVHNNRIYIELNVRIEELPVFLGIPNVCKHLLRYCFALALILLSLDEVQRISNKVFTNCEKFIANFISYCIHVFSIDIQVKCGQNCPKIVDLLQNVSE